MPVMKLCSAAVLVCATGAYAQGIGGGPLNGGGGGGGGSVTGGSCPSGQYASAVSSQGVPTCTVVPNSNVTLAPSATTDATNAYNISSGMLSASRIPTLNQNTTGTAATITGAITSTQVTGLAASATTDTTNAANIATGVLLSPRLPLQYATLHFTPSNLTQTVTHNLGILYPNAAPFYYLAGATACYFSANTLTSFSITCPAAADLVVSYFGGTPTHVGSYIPPTITWPTPAPVNSGTQLSATQLNATTTAAGTFTYNPASGTAVTSTQSLNVTFTPTDTTTYTTSTGSVTQVVRPAGQYNAINYYNMNEGSGQTFIDTGTAANNISGTGVTWTNGVATFPGGSATTTVGVRQVNAQAIGSSTAIVYAGWFNINASSSSAQQTLFANASPVAGQAGMEFFWVQGTSVFSFTQFSDLANNKLMDSYTQSGSAVAGTRRHLCVQLDGSGKFAGTSIYINGVKQTLNNNTDTLGSYSSASSTIALMSNPNGTSYGNATAGQLDHFGTYPGGTSCTTLYNSGQ